jgi:hypothetical protein
MFESAQILRNWREQRPSIEGDLDRSVTGEAGIVHCLGIDLFSISFLYRSTQGRSRVIPDKTLKTESKVLLSWFSDIPYTGTQQNRSDKMHR